MDGTIVHVVDDDPAFLTAITRLLRAAGYEVEGYRSAPELLQRLPDDDAPGCILLDVQIPGLSGPELQDRLRELDSLLPVIFLTGHGDIPTSVKAMKAGAEDFLTKPVTRVDLLKAVEKAVARHAKAREQHDRIDGLWNRVKLLTPREREVFEHIVRGRLHKQIAGDLGATERTIKAHRHRIMEKIKVRSLAELVMVAERVGILKAVEPGGGKIGSG